jgi:PAS domain S-box-containing protein
MRDEDKSRAELIRELAELRGRIAEGDQGGRKQADRLQEQNIFLQTLIEAIPMPVYYKDAEGRYTGCNTRFEKFTNKSREDFIGKTVHAVAPKELSEFIYQKDQALLTRGGTQVYRTETEVIEGKRRDVVFHKAAFNNAEGQRIGLVGVIQDITERVRIEEALRGAQQELEARVEARTAQLAKANEELKKEIEQRAEAERELAKRSHEFRIFAHSIVHDLKSPTIGLHGLARNLKKRSQDALDEKGHAYLDRIMEAALNVANLVDEINSYMASKEAPLKFEGVNMIEIFQALKDEFSRRIESRGIRLIFPGETINLMADRVSILRGLRNLIDNAIKYGGEQLTEIRVEYELDDRYHYLNVTDNGVGISAESREKIFGLFERDESSYALPGTGLGLAIVREISRRHDGNIRVMARTDGRTTFSLSISRFL